MFQGNRSLRIKVTLGVMIPLLLILSAFTALQYTRHRNAVLDDLSMLAALSGRIIEADLRHAMKQSDFEEVQAVLDAIGESEEFRVVYLMDTSGEVIFAPENQELGKQLDNQTTDCQPCHSLAPEVRPASVIVTADDGQRVFRSMRPIENSPECAECHGTEDRLRGLLLTDIPITPMEASLNTLLRENLIWWISTILGTVLVVNLVLNRFVLRRLADFNAAIEGIGQGIPPPHIPDDDPDELGQLANAFNDMTVQIQAREADNRALSQSLHQRNMERGELLTRLITAQEDERKRVARELHDELGQALGGLTYRAEAMGQFIASNPERVHESLDEIRTLSKETMQRMYELIWDLRPSELDDLGLVVAIRTYAQRALKEMDISLEIHTDSVKDRLPPEMEIALYRIFQEAITNIIRHAEASEIQIVLQQNEAVWKAEIIDDGCGFDPDSIRVNGCDPRGLGLLGMQERVFQFNGQLDICSQPGQGTRIRVCIPRLEASHD